MAGATKKPCVFWPETGKTLYIILLQVATDYIMDNATGDFTGANPASKCAAMSEHAYVPGFYRLSESRYVWADGIYYGFVYKQLDGSPAPSTDQQVYQLTMCIASDVDITFSDVDADTHALANNYTATRAAKLDNLDAAISSAATQASVNAIPTNTLLTSDTRLNHLDADVSSRATGASVAAIPTNPLLTADARIDAIDGILTVVTLLKKYVRNKKEILKDPTTGVKYLVIYDDDGVTEIIRKTLKDPTGADISDVITGALAVEGASSV